MIQFQENNQTGEGQRDRKTKGHMDGQNLFQRTLLVAAVVQKISMKVIMIKLIL